MKHIAIYHLTMTLARYTASASVEVVILPPIETDDWDYATLHEEIAVVRALYEKTLSD